MLFARSPLVFLTFLILLLTLFELREARQVFGQNSGWNRTPGNPGVRIRLTKKGINHLKTVAVRLLNEQIRGIKGYSSHYPFSNAGLNGYVNLHDVRVLGYHPPQLSVVNFLPPRYIVLGLENMDVQIAGNFDGNAPPFQVGGSVDGQIKGMTVALTTEFSTDEDGSMDVRVSNCSTIIQHSKFNLHPVGPSSGLVKAFQAQINDGIRRRIPNMFCKKLKNLIEKNSPKLFVRLSRQSLGESFKAPLSDNSVIQQFISDFVNGLFIDNRNIAEPVVTQDYFETQMRGEVRYNDSDYSTPFYPRKMNTPDHSDRMIHFFGSDYIFNSLLYHAYQQNKLNLRIDKTNLPATYKGFVSTSCDGFCVGRLIPAIGEAYPNTTTAFVLLTHGLPDFTFNGDAGAIKLSTRVITYVDDNGREKQIMVSSADGQCDLQLFAEDGMLSGDMKMNRLKVRLHRASIAGIEPKNIADLEPFAKNFIAPQLSTGLKRGMPFPIRDQLQFISPTLRIDDGYIELATDFLLNENALRAQFAEVFKSMKI